MSSNWKRCWLTSTGTVGPRPNEPTPSILIAGACDLGAIGASLTRYAAAVGAIWGIFIGASVMGFCLALVTLVQIAKVFSKKSAETVNRE